MTMSVVQDPASRLGTAFAVLIEDVVAGSGNDGVEVDGPSVDREVVDGPPTSPFLGGAILVTASAALTDTESLTVNVQIQHSVDDSVWVDFATLPAVLTLTATSTATFNGSALVTIKDPTTGVVIQAANKFLRAQVTPVMSAGATDTADLTAAFVFSGGAVYS